MGAVEIAAPAIAVEQRVEDLARQGGREEQRVAAQGPEDQGLQGAGGFAVLRQLLIVFLRQGLDARAAAPIDPWGLVAEQGTGGAELLRAQQVLELQQHGLPRSEQG